MHLDERFLSIVEDPDRAGGIVTTLDLVGEVERFNCVRWQFGDSRRLLLLFLLLVQVFTPLRSFSSSPG